MSPAGGEVLRAVPMEGMEPEALEELTAYSRPRTLRWERVPAAPPRAPTSREQAIMGALAGSFSILSSRQIAHRFMPEAVPRTVRRQLHELAAQGWARRAHLVCAGPGQTARLFAARESRLGACAAVRALHANAWFFAFERLVAGARARVSEDADLAIDVAGARLELEVGAWRRSLREALFRHERGSATVLFVLPDERSAIALARYADRVLEQGRDRCSFASEPDVHLGRLRALVLPRTPGGTVRLQDLRSRLPV
jgi:hypothetical protein